MRRANLLLLLLLAEVASLRPAPGLRRPVHTVAPVPLAADDAKNLSARAAAAAAAAVGAVQAPTRRGSAGKCSPTRAVRPPMLTAAKAPAPAPDGSGSQTRWQALASLFTRQNLSVFGILLAAFLNLLGFTMAGPITPALGSHFGLEVGASFGWLTSAYPAGMLLGLFLWPALSDRVGRKPVITLSLLGAGVGLAAQGYAVRQRWSLSAFLALRALTGSMAGASPVAKAYLADVGAGAGQLPRYMSWRDAASTLAFIVGPLLSGHLYLGKQAVGFARDQSLAAVISTSGAYSLVAGTLVALCVQETPSSDARAGATGAAVEAAGKQRRGAPPPEPSPPSSSEPELVACPLGSQLVTAVATVCVVSALFNCAASPFDSFFPSLIKDLAGIDEVGIGRVKAALASLSLLVSATVSARVQKRLGAVATCVIGLTVSSLGLAGLGLAAAASTGALPSTLAAGTLTALFWLSAAIFQVGVPLYGPTIPTMLLQCVPRHRRGAIMGLDSSINTVARIMAAPVLGALYRSRGPGACFAMASLAALVSAMTAIIRRAIVMRGLYGSRSQPRDTSTAA